MPATGPADGWSVRSVLVWRPEGFDDHRATAAVTTVCCLRSTLAGSRAVVYRAGADQGIAGVYDFLTDARPRTGGGWVASGVLHLLEPHLPRAALLSDADLAPVFTHIQARRRLPDAAARRLTALLPPPAARV